MKPGRLLIAAVLLAGLANLRLRNCKTGLLLAPDDRRQHARLLLRRAEDDDRLQPDTVAHAILRGLHHRYARI